MKKLVLIITICTLFGPVAFGQSEDGKATSGTVFSQLGVGFPVDIGNTAANSMGLLGVSFNEPMVGGLANPAHWGNTIYGLGIGGLDFHTYTAENSSNSATNTKFSVNQFQLQLPVVRGKFGISGSFSPVTDVAFRTYSETPRIIGEGALQDTLMIGLENRGSGGVNQIELGFGWQITPNISVGYAPSLVYISKDNTYEATFSHPGYRSANFTLETSGAGLGNRFGTFVRLPGIFRTGDQLGVGLTASLPVILDAEKKQTGVLNGITKISRDLPDGEGTIKMPMSLIGGISYSPSNALMIGTEGLYQGWSNYQNDFKPSEEQLFTDRYKVGLGLQYFPYVTGSDKFLSGFKYRLGTSYDSGHLKIEGQRINTLMFSLGLGIRSPRSSSSIDLSFEYGIRGTSDLVREQIWGVSLSLNLAEIMFFRPKLQ